MSTNPFTLYQPISWNLPLVLSAPHSGVEVPRGFNIPEGQAGKAIRSMSDKGIDQLALPSAQIFGFPVLSSRYLRAFIDLNRDEDELDPLLIDGLDVTHQRIEPESRVAAGLGLIPRLADQHTPVYSGKLSLRAVQSRVERYYAPYHKKLDELVSSCISRFGTCLLMDLHSMPPVGPALARRCLGLTKEQPTKANQRFPASPLNIVVGTNFGESLSEELQTKIRLFWQDEGLTVSMDRPYAGGYITTHHGKSISALQLEVCRGLYPGHDVSDTSKTMERLFSSFVERVMDQFLTGHKQAAE